MLPGYESAVPLAIAHSVGTGELITISSVVVEGTGKGTVTISGLPALGVGDTY